MDHCGKLLSISILYNTIYTCAILIIMDVQAIPQTLADKQRRWSAYFMEVCEKSNQPQAGIAVEIPSGKKMGLHWNNETKDLYVAINDIRITNAPDTLWDAVLSLAEKVTKDEA